MPRQRWAWTHKYAVPMFISSVVAVVVSGLGLLAALNWDSGTGPDGPDCLVGHWRMVSHTEALETGGTTVTLTLVGAGAVYEFRADGTGSADYGDGTEFEGDSFGQTIPATVDGTLNFRYEAADGTFQIVEMLSTSATFAMDFLGSPIEVPYRLSTTVPERYRCAGDAASFSAEDRGYAAEYRRIS